MEIDEKEIQKIINEWESQEMRYAPKFIEQLKELINEKWEPSKGIAEYPEEIFQAYFSMEERNKRIFLAKHEMGYGDGNWSIVFDTDEEQPYWRPWPADGFECPELSLEEEEQAETIIKMVGLNG